MYWVTIAQLLAWMRNPVPASELRSSSGAMCARPPPPPAPPPLPRSGVNVTLTLAGTPTQVADQKARLEAAVAALLGAGVSGSPFVAEAAAVASPRPASASAPSSAAAGGDSAGGVASMSVEESGPVNSWLQFESPSYSGSSAVGTGTVGARSMDAANAVAVQASRCCAGLGRRHTVHCRLAPQPSQLASQP